MAQWSELGNLMRKDPGTNPRLGLLNEFVLGDPRGNSPCLVNNQLVCLLPVGILNWERGGFYHDTEKPL